ncbi:MAG: hypothetical protein IT428_33530 [Planctomycetaceae bacterium]|nr:hypothetical protein [Planctomycetaceae bacterium]
MTERKTSAPWIAGAALLVLIGGYVGVYYATVTVKGSGDPFYTPHAWFTDGSKTSYLAWKGRLDRFFFPIHWLDRRIRPHVWEPTP